MRPIPVLTAILVMLALYGLVLQRDALLAFARGDAQAQQSDATPATDIAADTTPQQELIGVVVRRSEAREIDSAVILRGQTRAVRQVEVRAETTATVISEPLRKGAFVKQGDLLCKLDPGVREAALAETRARQIEAKAQMPASEARLIEARARLGEARINYNAAVKLQEGGYASQTRLASSEAAIRAAEAGLATAESGLDSTRAGIEAAEAAVAAAEREIARLTIFAPFDGLLESDTAELGSLMQPGSLCATVIQLDPIKLVGFVPETEVARVKVGAPAGAELATGQRTQGMVTFISRSADPLTRTFEVEISVPNPDLAIRDGQTAAIAVQAAGAMAHLLPQSALTLNNDGQLGVRVVGDDDIVGFLPVSLVRDTADGIWVDGLPAEANVIVVGQDFVTAGVRVRPTWQDADQ